MMQAVILARVSSAEQQEGHSLDAQLANLRAYADRQGFEVVRIFRIIESSTKGHRPEFERMIEFIGQQKKPIAMIVDCVDRLQRSFTHTPVLNSLMEQGRLAIHFVREGNVINKDANSMQKMMWNMGVVMAQSYTDQLSDNVRRSIKHKIGNGEWIAKAPLGYLNTTDSLTGRSTVILDPERAFLVKRLFTDYATGTITQNELARSSREWGLRTHKNKPLGVQTVSNILTNPFYMGVMRIKDELHPHNYQPLVTHELFEACQRQKRKPDARSKAPRQGKMQLALAGLITCAVSGRKVTCDRKKGRYTYLVVRHPANPNRKYHVPEKMVMEQIEAVLQAIHIHDDILTEMLNYLRQAHEAEKAHHHTQMRLWQQEADDITQKIDRLTDLLLDQSITKNIYAKKQQELAQRRAELDRCMADANEGDTRFKIALSGLIALANRIPDLFAGSTDTEKRAIIGFVFSNLQLEGEKLRYTLRKPFDLFANLADNQKWPYGI